MPPVAGVQRSKNKTTIDSRPFMPPARTLHEPPNDALPLKGTAKTTANARFTP